MPNVRFTIIHARKRCKTVVYTIVCNRSESRRFRSKKTNRKNHSEFFQLGGLEDLFVAYNQQFQRHSLALAELQGRHKAKAESQDEAEPQSQDHDTDGGRGKKQHFQARDQVDVIEAKIKYVRRWLISQ